MSQAGQSLLLTSVTNYFDKRGDHKKTLYEIVNGRSVLSLRVIDWFVTHYIKAYNTIYWVDDEKNRLVEAFPEAGGRNLRKVHLYLDYRAQLKSYTKLHFDPFRRHNRVSFVIDPKENVILETTVGQLNFFRWCFQNHIMDYICNHLAEIEKHMARNLHDRKKGTPEAPPPQKDKKKPRNAATGTDIITAPCCLHFS